MKRSIIGDKQHRIEIGQGHRDEIAERSRAVDHVGLELVARHPLSPASVMSV